MLTVIHLMGPGAALTCENAAGRVHCPRPATVLAVIDNEDRALCPACFMEAVRAQPGAALAPAVAVVV